LKQKHCGRSGQPGASSPGTFRPQGLATLSTNSSLPCLAKPVGFAASMGFSLQGLAPPGPRRPSRGLASPDVQKPRPQAEPSRLQRIVRGGRTAEAADPDRSSRVSGWADNRGGERRTSALGKPMLAAEPCPLGCSPLQGFLLRRLEASGNTEAQALPALRPRALPTVPLSGGASRVWRATKAACLSRDCRPSWGFAPLRSERLFGRATALAYGFTSATGKTRLPLRAATRPTGVRLPSRFGA